jgi:hypothetical protein
MQCIEIVGRNQPVELEIFWTSPSLTRKLSLFDHHIAEGGKAVKLTSCVLRAQSAPMRLDHGRVHQLECYVVSAGWSDGGRLSSGNREKDL